MTLIVPHRLPIDFFLPQTCFTNLGECHLAGDKKNAYQGSQGSGGWPDQAVDGRRCPVATDDSLRMVRVLMTDQFNWY